MRAACLLAGFLFCTTAAVAQDRPPAVYPSGSSVPENLLRISLRFETAPMRSVLSDLELLDDHGLIDGTFLNQELWSPDGKTLTVLLHPGRVKAGLHANVRLGRALNGQGDVTLRWRSVVLARWRVDGPDTSPPDPRAWQVETVPGRGRDPLVIVLDAPIDVAATDLIAVADADGRRVDGVAELSSEERQWRFTPARPWRAVAYTVRLHPNLEDAAGNRVGQRFEHGLGELAGVASDGPTFTVQ